jgi:hypothetical protein
LTILLLLEGVLEMALAAALEAIYLVQPQYHRMPTIPLLLVLVVRM